MTSFYCFNSRRWDLKLTPAVVARVRELVGVDLDRCNDPADGCALIAELLDSDHGRFIDVLYVACMDQAKERGIADWRFGRSLAGAIKSAVRAFCDAVCVRFPGMTPHLDAARLLAQRNR